MDSDPRTKSSSGSKPCWTQSPDEKAKAQDSPPLMGHKFEGVILRSPREIAMMREAGLLVWHAHRLVESLLAPGVTTAELDAAVERFFADENAVPLFKGVPGK